jgi:hypothetical protein
MAPYRTMRAAVIVSFGLLGVSLTGCVAQPVVADPVTSGETPKPQAPPANKVSADARPKASYPAMAPLEEYLIADRDAEIALARSAAPAAISKDASVVVLTRKGYQTAVEGKNGFVCLVDRAWSSPFDDPEFWNPKKRGPTCMNAAAVR